MENHSILHLAAEYVTEWPQHGSPSMIRRRLRQEHGISVTFEVARSILAQLYGAGVVAPVDMKTHAHPVLMDRTAAIAAVSEYQVIGGGDWSGLYECPQCFRVAPWTDGRSVKAGDEVDEYWCQTCGAEVPVAACKRTELLLPA
jgi:hypothetical protein